MAQLTRPARIRLELSDIGAWLFRFNGNDMALVPPRAIPFDSRCAVRSYRLDLIRAGHPVVLWRTGPTGRTPPPGVWMVGYATGEVRDDPADPKRAQVILTNVFPLPHPLRRADIVNQPAIATMEVLRQPFGPNPSYLTPAEQTALQHLIGGWPGDRPPSNDPSPSGGG